METVVDNPQCTKLLYKRLDRSGEVVLEQSSVTVPASLCMLRYEHIEQQYRIMKLGETKDFTAGIKRGEEQSSFQYSIRKERSPYGSCSVSHFNSNSLFEYKLYQASKCKTEGNVHFGKKRWKIALRFYLRGLQFGDISSASCSFSMQENEAIRPVLVSLHMNAAAALLKVHKPAQSVKHCTKALQLDTNNVKALYRRSQAYESLQEFESAIGDLQKSCDLAPENVACRRALERVLELNKRRIDTERSAYARMFKN